MKQKVSQREYDAITRKVRHSTNWKPGQRKAIKRDLNRRIRRMVARELARQIR